MGRTIHLDNGKYVFVINSRGIMTHAYRNGEAWPAGLEMGYQKAFMAALDLIFELQEKLASR